MSTTTTPVMGMVLPVPSSEPGPAWASELITALTNILDAHDHTSGKGNKIVPSAMNINGDLSMNSMNLTTARTLRMNSQSATLSGGTEIRELYVVGNELYYNDQNGTAVKLTANGFVNVATSAGIGGDYGGANPASVFYTDATDLYSFTTDPGVFAEMKFRGFESVGKICLFTTAVSSSPYTINNTSGDTNAVLLVDTSAARTINLPNPSTQRRLFIIKDTTGTSETNAITLHRFAAENIDGVAADLVLKKNSGIWYLISDLTNWWVLKTELQDKTSVTVFDGSTSVGSDTIPTAFASPTLSAAAFTEGTAVTRSTNTLTFPFTGKYRVDFLLSELNKSGGSADVLMRVRNTTDSTTSAVSVNPQTNGTVVFSVNVSMFINVTDIAKNYEIQWVTSSATTNVTNVTVNGETGPRWRIVITKLKNT